MHGTEVRPTSWLPVLAVLGFVAVATANASNMVMARALAGEVPAFSLAFFRWTIVALGLLPFVAVEVLAKRRQVAKRLGLATLTGFAGMFVCGGPVYLAGATTPAMNIALIFAAMPVLVLVVSWALNLERVRPAQLLGIAFALPGVLAIVARGSPAALLDLQPSQGDVLAFVGMLGWAAYNLLQPRALPGLSFLARTCVYAGLGALFSLPFCIAEAVADPGAVFSGRALASYLFAGLVPGIVAYAGLALLAARFGAVRASLMTYVAPASTAVLSILVLGEAPAAYHAAGAALILGGVWLSLRR
jgi:drug/metabolite transporter (DMT)-like permease